MALIDFNEATSITLNEFVWSTNSTIILVGSTNGIDGFSVASQTRNTLIQSNLIHGICIYAKQSAPVLIAVSRNAFVIGNLMFNLPRTGININDGFYGNHTFNWNVIFNTVRETGDHMDRSLHGIVFGNYNCLWPIDHDDGSCFYGDSYNFHVYGGKKNFLGYPKMDHHRIYVYAYANPGDYGSNICMGDYAPVKGSSGWNVFVPYLALNKIYIPAGIEVAFICKMNGIDTRLSLQQWQSYGVDIGTTVETTPNISTIIQWGRDMLQHAT